MSTNDLKRLNSVSLLLFYWDKISHYMAQSDLEPTMSCLTHAEPQFLIAFSGFWSTELVCSKATHITIFWDSSFQNLSSLNMLVGLEFKIGNYFQILTWYISAETTTEIWSRDIMGTFYFQMKSAWRLWTKAPALCLKIVQFNESKSIATTQQESAYFFSRCSNAPTQEGSKYHSFAE